MTVIAAKLGESADLWLSVLRGPYPLNVVWARLMPAHKGRPLPITHCHICSNKFPVKQYDARVT